MLDGTWALKSGAGLPPASATSFLMLGSEPRLFLHSLSSAQHMASPRLLLGALVSELGEALKLSCITGPSG